MSPTLTKEALKEVIKEALQEVLSESGGGCHCNLDAVDITPAIHQAHHKTLQCMSNDVGKIRVALLTAALVGAGSGIAGLLWLGLKLTLQGLPEWLP